jgi:hypothetical protein
MHWEVIDWLVIPATIAWMKEKQLAPFYFLLRAAELPGFSAAIIDQVKNQGRGLLQASRRLRSGIPPS